MKITIRLFANFREAAGKKDVVVEVEGDRVLDAIIALARSFPALEERMMQKGEVRPYVNVMLNGRNVKDESGMMTAIKDGDELAVFPPVSGG